MNLIKKSTLTALLAITSTLAVNAGDCWYKANDCNNCKADPCCGDSYIFGYGGVSFSNGFDSSLLNVDAVRNNFLGAGFDAFTAASVAPQDRFELDSGFIVGGGAGVRSDFLCGSRFEFEGLYQSNDLTSISPLAFTNGGVNFPGRSFGEADGLTGNISTTAVMFNLLKEIPLGCITGYVGGGIGFASVESDITFQGDRASDSDIGFAHQFIVGADFPVSNCFSIFLQYKLFNSGDVELLCPSGVPGIVKVAEYDSTYQSSVTMGGRFHF